MSFVVCLLCLGLIEDCTHERTASYACYTSPYPPSLTKRRKLGVPSGQKLGGAGTRKLGPRKLPFLGPPSSLLPFTPLLPLPSPSRCRDYIRFLYRNMTTCLGLLGTQDKGGSRSYVTCAEKRADGKTSRLSFYPSACSTRLHVFPPPTRLLVFPSARMSDFPSFRRIAAFGGGWVAARVGLLVTLGPTRRGRKVS